MTPPTTVDEAQARAKIDTKLIEAGWVIQHNKRLNLHESLGGSPAVPGNSRFVRVDCVGACESGANNHYRTNSNYTTADLRAA